MSLAAAATDVLRRNNVHEQGNPVGRPMMFAHGFGCSQEMWRRVAPYFSDYRVVLFDHIGAGKSDVQAYDPIKYDSLHGYSQDVIEILDALDLRDIIFVGHSVSAMIGVMAAVERPDLIGDLVLVGPSPRYVNTEGYVGGFEQADIDNLLDTLDANYLGWSEAMGPVIAGNSDRPEVAGELTESFCKTDPAIARQFAEVTFLSDNRRDLERVTARTIVLQCSDDVIAPEVVGSYVHANIAGSEFVQLRASGHCPNISDPDELTDAIRAFLQ